MVHYKISVISGLPLGSPAGMCYMLMHAYAHLLYVSLQYM